MSVSILNNIPSLAAQNQLAITGSNLQKTLFRLSSGSRINTGADDAAGLAIADGLHSNVTALTQSARNANDGVGFLQVADGALAQVTTLLNRGVTLATESATGSVTQRNALDSEYQAISNEITRIGNTTTYNGTQVFSGATLNVFLSDASTNSTIGLTTGTLTPAQIGLGQQASGTLTAIGIPVANDTVTVNGRAYKFVAAVASANDVKIGADAVSTLANLVKAINLTGVAGTDYGSGTTINTDVSAAMDPSGASVVQFTARTAGAAGNGITLAKSGATMGVSGGVLAGGSDGGSLTTAASATLTLTAINNAIQTVAGMRGTIGANINRLQSASNVMSNQVQNLSAAEDGIRAADVPAEVANMTKYSILNQTAISALAQANQMQQSVLSLLK